jgi:cytochrome c oxidase subunit 2
VEGRHDARRPDRVPGAPSADPPAPDPLTPEVPRRRSRSRSLLPLALLAPVVLAGCQLPDFGAFRGSTTQGQDAFKLWQFFMIAGFVVGGITLLLITWAILRYRRRSEEVPRQTQYRPLIEITYTVLPILVVIALFVFTVITENEVDAVPKSQVTIDVTAFQWGWQFYYPDTGKVVIGQTLQQPQMEMPVGEDVTIHLESADVYHGFYVPDFNFSRYAAPGYVNTFNFNALHTGVYRGQCTQLCGLYHSLMLFTVKVVTPGAFDTWVHQTSGRHPTIGQLKNQIRANGPGA